MLALSAMWRPAYQVLQMEMADPAWRSLMSGAGAMAMSLGFASMSYSGGYIVVAAGYRWVFLIGVGLSTMSAALMTILLSHRERRSAADSSTSGAPLPPRRRGIFSWQECVVWLDRRKGAAQREKSES
jgi:MFS family permease